MQWTFLFFSPLDYFLGSDPKDTLQKKCAHTCDMWLNFGGDMQPLSNTIPKTFVFKRANYKIAINLGSFFDIWGPKLEHLKCLKNSKNMSHSNIETKVQKTVRWRLIRK